MLVMRFAKIHILLQSAMTGACVVFGFPAISAERSPLSRNHSVAVERIDLNALV